MAEKAIYNEATGKWEFPEPVKPTGEGKPTAYDPTIARLPISRDKIHEICEAVGYIVTGETEKGKAMKEATFATKFIDKAVEHELMVTHGERVLVAPDMVKKQPKNN
jgi:hypothetical protein